MTPSRAPVRNGARFSKGSRFLPGTSRRALCRMIKRPSPRQGQGHPGRLLQAQGGQRNIVHRARTDEAVLHHSRPARPDGAARLEGRFDRKPTGRKKILNPQTLKKIMGWTRRDPSWYGLGPASWRLDMVNEMIRRETGRHARPRTPRRILRRLGLSYSKPRVTPIENFASNAVVQKLVDVKPD